MYGVPDRPESAGTSWQTGKYREFIDGQGGMRPGAKDVRVDFIPHGRYHGITSFRSMYLERRWKGDRYDKNDF